MKNLYFLFFLTLSLFANAQIVNIPDANFKASLLNASPSNQIASTETPIYDSLNNTWSVTSYHSIDVNGNGVIELSEAQAIKFLDVGNKYISNLEGISSFTNIEFLGCSGNSLTNLDLSSLSNLKGLNCYFNQIVSLIFSSLANLNFLTCSNNQLTNLELSSFTNIDFLDCQGNSLTNLDLSSLSNLKVLLCSSNSLNNIDVSNLMNLSVLYCSSNQLVSLNVSNLNNLIELNCSSNQLTTLDVSNCSNLQILNCHDNQFTSIDVSDLVNLIEFYCNSNQLTSIDVSGLSNLLIFDCTYNQLTNIDVFDLINLIEFRCGYNLLTSLDVSHLPSLQSLSCFNNQLTYLNVKNGNVNGVPIIGFSENPNLQYICSNEIDIANLELMIGINGIFEICHVNSYCSFTPNGTFYEISGNTKFDSNSNGCDVSDINYSKLNFSITDGTNSGSLIANQTGNYYIPVSAGNHTITPNLENPTYFNVSPANFTVEFPMQASPFTQDFCVTANGIHHDVEVVLIPTVPARPGFDANYKLVYRNKGNQVENGSISLTFDDSRLDYVAANPVYNSSATNSFTWNYSNLQPFETREIEIVFNVNSPLESPAVNNGDQLDFIAQITPFTNDEIQFDNFSSLKQIVVGSYDPNDKTCIQGETIAPSEVGSYVHYLIRFENTGTYPAENIVVKDMIDLDKFDIATLVPLKSSHDFFTKINGNKVEFIFENINLDFNDATNDGYVVFKIKTLPSLVLGDTFTNNANIYFDYNFPITTNTYSTTIAALSTQDFDFGTYFTLYPNPAKEVINIQSKQDVAINSIEIYNQFGQIVMATTNVINVVDVANLASGMYFVKLNTDKGNTIMKFMKE